MASDSEYEQIQIYVKKHYNNVPKTCWIAHVKDSFGLTRGVAPNRQGKERKYKCPPDKWPQIEAALRHFKMI